MTLFGKKQTNSYKIKVQCNNCKITGILNARKGMKVEEAVKADVCYNCGCQMLKQLSDEEYEKQKPVQAESSGLFG